MANGYNQYIGMRYVPIVDGAWSATKSYEPLVVVTYNGNSYISKTFVPTGTIPTNEEYWILSANYNAQVEQYRQEVKEYQSIVENFNTDISDITTDVEGLHKSVSTLNTDVADLKNLNTVADIRVIEEIGTVTFSLNANSGVHVVNQGYCPTPKIPDGYTTLLFGAYCTTNGLVVASSSHSYTLINTYNGTLSGLMANTWALVAKYN